MKVPQNTGARKQTRRAAPSWEPSGQFWFSARESLLWDHLTRGVTPDLQWATDRLASTFRQDLLSPCRTDFHRCRRPEGPERRGAAWPRQQCGKPHLLSGAGLETQTSRSLSPSAHLHVPDLHVFIHPPTHTHPENQIHSLPPWPRLFAQQVKNKGTTHSLSALTLRGLGTTPLHSTPGQSQSSRRHWGPSRSLVKFTQGPMCWVSSSQRLRIN